MKNQSVAIAAALSLIFVCAPLRAATLPAPTGVIVIACGHAKMTLYWNKVKGARRYHIYRSLKPHQKSTNPFAKPLQIADSYASSPMKIWVDRGLTDGREYFYTIRAVDAKGHLGSPSHEDSDFVDPTATPWDTRNPRLIMQHLIKEGDAGDPDGKPMGRRGSAMGMAPDGYIYERLSNGQFRGSKPQVPDFAEPTA